MKAFAYEPRLPFEAWYPCGPAAENPDRPLFHGERYRRLWRCYLQRLINDPRLREHSLQGSGCGVLGVANIRRAALNQPLFDRCYDAIYLYDHLRVCENCQRHVELYREAIQSEEG